MTRVIYFEIHAEQPQRAVDFYKKVFGWEANQWDSQEYWMLRTGPGTLPGINGAILRRKGNAPEEGAPVNAFACTIDVVSVDTTLQIVQENGGKIVVEKVAVPGTGWLAYCNDTEGNIFGIMQSDPEAA